MEKVKYTNSGALNRVIQVKAGQQASTFFNGSTISSDMIIKTTERKNDDSTTTVETLE